MGTSAGGEGTRDAEEAAGSPFPGEGEMAARCRALDWASTSLGAPATWPAALRTLVRTCLESPFPVNLWCGPDLVLLYNDAYRRVLGAKHPRALGRPGLEVWADIRDDIAPMFAQIRAGGPPIYAEDARFVMARPAGDGDDAPGEEAYFTFGLSAVRDDAGAIVAFFNPAAESTARVLAERRLEAANRALELERARLAAVFAQSPSFLAVLRGADNVFEFVNPAYQQIVGQGRALLGRPLFEALPETRGQRFDEFLGHVRTTGQPLVFRELPARLERVAGAPLEDRYIDITYLPLVEADGTHDAVIAHGADVTEQVRARTAAEAAHAQLGEQALELELANQQLLDQTAELEMHTVELQATAAQLEARTAEAEGARRVAQEANRAKSEFLAVMSHELRTPLNAIGGYAELLAMGIHGIVTPEQRQSLERIQASQRHLLGLINQVLNYARVDAGALRYELEDVPALEALAAAEALVLPQARARGLRYVLAGGCAPDVALRADPEKLQQILLNLLTNAIKFTEPGGEVRMSCAAEATRVCIAVADTGIGIAPEKLESIFEPFVQVDQRFTRAQEGVGLGLAISRDLARGMGGDLTVASAPGVGSTFTLVVPRA